MILGALAALCGAVHAAALMLWFGTISLQRAEPAADLAPLEAGRKSGARKAGAGASFGRWAGPAALISGALWIWLQAGTLLDSPAAMFDSAQMGPVLLQTSFGNIWLAREALILLAVLAGSFLPLPAAAVSARLSPKLPPNLPQYLPQYFLLAAALASLGLLGHAAGTPGAMGTAQRTLVALHLLAAGAWLGALPVLWARCAQFEHEVPVLAQLLRWFSRYGLLLVAIAVVSGAASAVFRIGSLGALVSTAYGRILLVKVALVGLMGLAALINRVRLVPMLERPDLQVQQAARRTLRMTIAVEAGIGIAVVAAAVVLAAADAPQ
jgi:putative copper resistance protein D